MGRTPDYVSSLVSAFAGFARRLGLWRTEFADNVQRFYRCARREDLFIVYAIVR